MMHSDGSRTEDSVVEPPLARRFVWGRSHLWWAVLSFWFVVSLASGLEMTLLQTVTWRETLLSILSRLIPWLLMTVLIIRISATWILDFSHWRRSLWIYLAAFVISMALVAVFTYFGPPPALIGGQKTNALALFAGSPRSMMYLVLAHMTSQAPTFWGLVAVAHVVRFFEREDSRKLREAELRTQLIQARLQALQSQLNPHFLFNTLNSIASLLHDNPATAEQMIEALGELLRLATTTHRHQVTVREELHFLDQYLLIQRIRFGDRLQVHMQIDQAMLQDLVPVLILQPLVENAVKHGVETQLGPCLIEISVQAAGAANFLRLEVGNSGPAQSAPAGKIKEGVGLSNTRARVQEMYGPAASLELHPGRAGGFTVRILLQRLAPQPAPVPLPKLEVTT
jgi:two-component sensor histidine kinase